MTPAPGPSGQKWYRKTWVIVAAAAVVALLVGVAIGSGAKKEKTVTKEVPGPVTTTTGTTTVTTTATLTVAPTATVTTTFTPQPAATVGTGSYLVPNEIQPGVWHTDNPSGSRCYWERDSSLDGTLDSIIANDNISGPTTIQIAATDKLVKFNGPCQWAKIG